MERVAHVKESYHIGFIIKVTVFLTMLLCVTVCKVAVCYKSFNVLQNSECVTKVAMCYKSYTVLQNLQCIT